MLNDSIKTIRKNKGYSQEELANKLHVTRQTLSKWENGQSEPSANMLREMAGIFEVPVSELLDGDAERIIENQVIIDQLSRVNEHLVVAQKRSDKRVRVATCMFVAAIIIIAIITGLVVMQDKSERGQRIKGMEHIGVLTYFLPDDEYYHAKDDIGIKILENGSQQITGKTYKNYDDVSELSIWCYDEYDQELINEFKSDYANQIKDFTEDNGDMPKDIEFFIAATDGGYDDDDIYKRSSFYKALFLLDGRLYLLTVDGGDDPLSCGQMLVSTLEIDKSLEEEFVE